MAEGLTFEQVKKARVFAWHERHYVFADDTLLRVVTPYHAGAQATDREPSPMLVRPSSLRGSEHLLDDGWHHLGNCSCRYCCRGRDEAEPDRRRCDLSNGSGT